MKEINNFLEYFHKNPWEGAGVGLGTFSFYKMHLLMLNPISFHDQFFELVANTTALIGLLVVCVTGFFQLRKLFDKKLWDK